jgi:CHAT domain-containing protein
MRAQMTRLQVYRDIDGEAKSQDEGECDDENESRDESKGDMAQGNSNDNHIENEIEDNIDNSNETIRGDRELRVLLVSESSPPGQERLHLVDRELDIIAKIAAEADVRIVDHISSPASVSSVVASLPNANVVHLACHGIQNTESALDSGFCLHDGLLTVAQLMDLRLDDAFLAFTCACETVKGDKKSPNQVVHLGAAMLFAGFKNVIGTMWYVNV